MSDDTDQQKQPMIPGHVIGTASAAPLGLAAVLLLQAFGVPITPEQTAAIVPIVSAGANWLGSIIARHRK